MKINCPPKAAAAELADGVFKGAILVQIMVCKSSTSHSLVTSPSGPENPPIRYILLSRWQME